MRHEFRGKKFTAIFTDENGHYSLTGTVEGVSGAIGERLVEIDNRFQPLLDLHLCDVETGKPLHAWENAGYAASTMNWESTARHLRIFGGRNDLAQRYAHAVVNGDEEGIDAVKSEIEEIWQDRIDELDDTIDCLEYDYAPENRPEFVEPLDENGDVLPAYVDLDNGDDLDRMTALARHLDCNINQIEPAAYGQNCFEGGGKEFFVLTEYEADEAWNESLDSYIDDCLDVPSWIEPYFDRDAWKRDAKMDSRGHALSPYDGHEYDEYGTQTASGSEIYYIYRQN